MQYFKNDINAVYAYEDDADPKFIIDGLTEITEAEAMALLNPPLTPEQHIAQAEEERQRRIDAANDFMNNKQCPGKAAIGRLKGEELARYNQWLDYLDALYAVDTSAAPDIEWPTPPAQ